MSAEPRVEDLLASIRKAIDDEESPLVTSTEEQGTLTRGPIREMRIAYNNSDVPAAPPRKDAADDLAALRSRVARSSAETGFAAPPAPRFRIDNSVPQAASVSPQPVTPQPVAPQPVATQPVTSPRNPPPRPSVFAEILSGAGEVPPRARAAAVAHSTEPPYLRRSQNDASYEDEFTEVIPVYEDPHYSSRPTRSDTVRPEPVRPEAVRAEPVYRAPEPPRWPTPTESESYDYDPAPQQLDYEPPPPQNPYSPPLQHAAPQPAPAPPPYRPQNAPQNALVSHESTHNARRSFDDLAEAVLSRATNDRGLEDMTRDLLRNYLARWLDENLPSLVEQLVREEIERVARRGN